MKRILLFIILGFFTLSLTSCENNYVEKTSETMSKDVYAIVDAFKAGRIDLVEKYINELKKLVPFPLKRLLIKPIIAPDGTRCLILGDTFKNTKVYIIGGEDFNKLLQYKNIAAQFKNDQQIYQQQQIASDKQAAHNQEITNKLISDNSNLKKEVAEYHDSIEYKIKHFWLFAKFIIPISIIGLIAACFFFPPLLGILGTIFGIFVKIFNIFLEILSNVIGFFTKKV